MKSRIRKPVAMKTEELMAIVSAIYTQIEAIKALGLSFEGKRELKHLRSAQKKILKLTLRR